MTRLKLLNIPFVRKIIDDFPFVVVDVGASGGMLSTWASFPAPIRYVGFEPDANEYKKLVAKADPKRELYLNTGVAGRKGEVDFHITRLQACSSLLEPNQDFLGAFRPKDFEVIDKLRVAVDTLDNQLNAANVPAVDVLKIDTQGTELEILSGASNALRDAFVIDVEVEFHSLYRGQPLFGDVDSRLRESGFECFDMFPRYWKRAKGKKYGSHRGQMIFAEAIYLRSIGAMRQYGDALRTDAKVKICKAVVLCALYGYADYAVDLLDAFPGLFSSDELAQFERGFAASTPFTRRLPNFRGKRRLAKLFLALHYICRF